MPVNPTPNIGLSRPPAGYRNWTDLLNGNMDIIDGILGVGGRYVGRPGVASGHDWGLGDLVMDGAWHVLDTSALVPAGAIAIAWRLVVLATALGKFMMVAENGSSDGAKRGMCRANTTGWYYESCPIVQCTSARTVQYYLSAAGISNYGMTVMGWYKSA